MPGGVLLFEKIAYFSIIDESDKTMPHSETMGPMSSRFIPVCGTNDSTKAAYSLIIALCDTTPLNYRCLVESLLEFFYSGAFSPYFVVLMNERIFLPFAPLWGIYKIRNYFSFFNYLLFNTFNTDNIVWPILNTKYISRTSSNSEYWMGICTWIFCSFTE